MGRPAQFDLAGAEACAGGYLAAGRVAAGPLRVGDVFTRVLARSGGPPFVLAEEGAVRLRVEEIYAGGRLWGSLHAGLLAELRLRGPETPLLRPGRVLAADGE